jgi:hypothetical protein
MTKPKYTPEERKRVKAENLRKNIEAAKAKGYTQKFSNREKAIMEGEKKYLSKTPCKECGEYERYVSSYGCCKCAVETGLKKLADKELMAPYRTKEKQSKRLKEWRKENPEKYQNQWLRSSINRYRYQITEEQYCDKLEEQDNKCAICESECDKGRLSIDHNHETNEVRGLLCRQCNLGLGNFSDNIDKLEAAVLYLKRHNTQL